MHTAPGHLEDKVGGEGCGRGKGGGGGAGGLCLAFITGWNGFILMHLPCGYVCVG